MEKFKAEFTIDQLTSIGAYIDSCLSSYVPDHKDYDLLIRMELLKTARVKVGVKMLEVNNKKKQKLTLSKMESLALAAAWTEDLTAPSAYLRLTVGTIAAESHKKWM